MDTTATDLALYSIHSLGRERHSASQTTESDAVGFDIDPRSPCPTRRPHDRSETITVRNQTRTTEPAGAIHVTPYPQPLNHA